MHHEELVTLPEGLASFGIEHPILVGHSDGASIALIHARAGHPVAGNVALSPHVFVKPLTTASIETSREQFATTDLNDPMARYHQDPAATFRGWNDIWLDPASLDWDITEYLPKIECPVLLIPSYDAEYRSFAHLDTIENRGLRSGRTPRTKRLPPLPPHRPPPRNPRSLSPIHQGACGRSMTPR